MVILWPSCQIGYGIGVSFTYESVQRAMTGVSGIGSDGQMLGREARMKSILYVSVADPELVSDDIYQLVGNAQQRNAADNISGVMLYNGSNFLQLIEGEEAIIDACFARIHTDPRHSGVITLRNDICAVREFPRWAMRYSLVEQPSETTLAAVREAGAPRVETLDRIAAFVGLNRRGR